MHCEDNNQEEADTLMICLAVMAAHQNPGEDVELMFFSPDTDVLVLAIANYDLLPRKTSIFMASGVLPIKSFWTALGTEKANCQNSMPSLGLTILESLQE